MLDDDANYGSDRKISKVDIPRRTLLIGAGVATVANIVGLPGQASADAPYDLPCDARVSDTWLDHKNRGSAEPGTDYACPVGTSIHAADAGTVIDVKLDNSAATGRYLAIDLDDGRRVRYLHLSELLLRS